MAWAKLNLRPSHLLRIIRFNPPTFILILLHIYSCPFPMLAVLLSFPRSPASLFAFQHDFNPHIEATWRPLHTRQRKQSKGARKCVRLSNSRIWIPAAPSIRRSPSLVSRQPLNPVRLPTCLLLLTALLLLLDFPAQRNNQHLYAPNSGTLFHLRTNHTSSYAHPPLPASLTSRPAHL
jgi:hypothetical protein